MNMKKVDLAKITLGVLFLSLLIISCFMVLRPFLPALVWATMITIATWPLMLMVQRLLWGKRTLAALSMTLVLLLMFVIPLFMALANVAEKAPMLIELGTTISHSPPPSCSGCSRCRWWAASSTTSGSKFWRAAVRCCLPN